MKPTRSRSNSDKTRIQLLHQYYSYTGFYEFVWIAIKNAFPYIVGFIAAVVTANQFIDVNATLARVTELLPVYGVLGFFFVSETILGLVPPEIFIAWSGNMPRPWMYLSILALLSYSGGLMAYWLGKFMTSMPAVHNYLEVKMAKQLRNSKKWGGILIVIGALLPVPFAVSCMTAGIIKYPFKSVVYYGSLRMVRIFAYGFVVFSML
ncbi:YqaA family protein [Winogradskyella vincentii]|uniref:VTT domain-containing protein n=1 Tax=Winogradskyella vincentii TaxID=2877122 RepID=A0ABS7XZH9_9FLAO|nr:VTT domain-containing protein [Winogradskyella vincentii]MCA0153061.1 VTT domain-containing protein [Winogradskyella vincentii]